MSKLMNLLTGHGKGDGEVGKVLSHLDRDKTPIRVEIESANVHFYTRLSIKSATVIVAKPMGLREGLSKGSTVRFKVPGEENLELRLEVITPHFNLSTGNSVFLCKVPNSFVEDALRASDRFNTSRFNNICVMLPNFQEAFRVIDLSVSGCKIFLHNLQTQSLFTVGESIPGACLHLGDKVRVDLEALVPRNHRGQTVGCQLRLPSDGSSRKYLDHLIHSLQKVEADKLRT